jgi:hypothetical protein
MNAGQLSFILRHKQLQHLLGAVAGRQEVVQAVVTAIAYGSDKGKVVHGATPLHRKSQAVEMARARCPFGGLPIPGAPMFMQVAEALVASMCCSGLTRRGAHGAAILHHVCQARQLAGSCGDVRCVDIPLDTNAVQELQAVQVTWNRRTQDAERSTRRWASLL